MKTSLLSCGLFVLLSSSLAPAAPIVIVGTPGNSLLQTPTGPSPNLHGTLLNFDGLTANSTYTSSPVQGITITSPDGLLVIPFSTQSGPNELFDNSAAGTANITIAVGSGVWAIGFGIADSDPVSITIQALNSNGTALGSAITENLATTENLINTGNGYYVIEDTTPDIFGVQITQSVGSVNNSGLAIDDVQSTPEPSSVLLLGTGVALLGSFRLRKRA